jgi:hypothetical protein
VSSATIATKCDLRHSATHKHLASIHYGSTDEEFTFVMRGLKLAVVAAIFVSPFTYPGSAVSWNALTYQQAVQLCQRGFLDACNVVLAYEAEMARWRAGGSPADKWVSPQELPRQRPGALSTWDLLKRW